MSQQRPDRIKQMLHYLWQHRHLSTQQAMELFGYAEATVRRDFQYIVNQYPGMIRGHGCLDFDDSTDDKEYVFDVKRTLQSVAKREIAALARTMIKDGDCFFLDSGSTCLELAKCLADARVKVICNDIKIANELGCFPHVESYIIGGLIRPGYFSVGESLALEMINAFSVERAFISCDALSLETGITNATMFEVGVKTRIIQRSREVILMADHSKFDAVEPHAVATLSCIKTIISDSGLPETIAQRYLGTWYEIARFDHRFERGLEKVTATYSLRDDGGLNVINKGYNPDRGMWQQSEGKAYFTGAPTRAALKVSFFGPFYGGYNVIALDREYRHALVCGPDRDYLWILSRTPTISDEVKQEMLAVATREGFDVSKFIWVQQPGS